MSATLWASYGNEIIPIVSLWCCRQGFLFDFTPQLVRNPSFIGYLCNGPEYINIWNLTKFQTTLLNNPDYKRTPSPLIWKNQKIIATRALIVGRAGMLQCANNFSTKYKTKTCTDCGVTDDESHRINDCVRWEMINMKGAESIINFEDMTRCKIAWNLVVTKGKKWKCH